MDAFSNSTFVEGYSSNGTLRYGFYGEADAFISNAHAWSTGPVFSLLNDVVGLQASPVDMIAGGGDWAFKPSVAGSGLRHAQGGFDLLDGSFAASWSVCGESFFANITTPSGTHGTNYIPIS